MFIGMLKTIKWLVMLPLWPLVWLGETDPESSCGANAKAMRRWYEGKPQHPYLKDKPQHGDWG